jgi:hypothetical protein
MSWLQLARSDNLRRPEGMRLEWLPFRKFHRSADWITVNFAWGTVFHVEEWLECHRHTPTVCPKGDRLRTVLLEEGLDIARVNSNVPRP